jgi:hypothetical protein
MNKYVSLIFLALFFAVLSSVASAQSVIKGVVCDPNRAVVPNASITAVNKTGKIFEGKTNDDGSYQIRVTPGEYAVTFRATGFAGYRVENVSVRAAREERLNIQLHIYRCEDCNGAIVGDRWDDFTYVQGTVYDRFGQRIANAKVAFVRSDGVEQSISTDKNGFYRVKLAIYNNHVSEQDDAYFGPYKVRIEMPSFQVFTIEKYKLPVMERGALTLDVTLENNMCDQCE